MSVKEKLKDEIKSIAMTALYFGCWIAALQVLKSLVLAEYHIAFRGWPMVVVGALVLSKVVLVLEHVSLGAWVRKRPAWVDVVLRTALFSAGLVAVLVLEKGFEARNEYGGFLPALSQLFQQTDIHHVWANSVGLSSALLGYNVLFVVRRNLGDRGLLRMFLSPLPEETKDKQPTQ